MSDEFKIIGFHGTFVEAIDSIVKEGFHIVRRDNHWLGQGVYFYDNSPLARWWISRNSKSDHQKRDKGTSFVVIKAQLSSTVDSVLDLDSVEGVNSFYQKIHENWDVFRTVQFSNDEHKNLCFVLDVLSEQYGFKIIIKTFESLDPSYGLVNTRAFDRELFKLNVRYKERQICVRSNPCIKILELEYPDTEYTFKSKIRFSWSD